MVENSRAMIDGIIEGFMNVYGANPPELIARAPGRVELIGGHTDYNEGFVIASAIDKSCWVAAAGRNDKKIVVYSELLKEQKEFELSKELKATADCKWVNYVIGVAAVLMQEGLSLKGADLYLVSHVPLGSGLSSSAALEVSTAKAMLSVSGVSDKVSDKRLSQLCQKAENVYAGSPCGIMDQTVSIMAKKDHAVFLDCRDVSIKTLPFDSKACCIMTFNSMVQHEVGGGEYGKRRARCEEARDILKKKYPQVRALRDADEAMLESVKTELEPVTFARASHVIGENARVLAAAEALKKNDMWKFGELMSKSHCSARDLYEISCPETDFIAEQLWQCKGIYGARIMGGGFGGSVVGLAEPKQTEAISEKITRAYKKKFNIDCQVHIAHPWQGPEVISIGYP